jgi:phosphatidylglycerol:prolipoprotein diacylglycerol transferase
VEAAVAARPRRGTAPSLAIGQAIGRWGNFFNEEAFGRPTDLPWKLYISPPHRPLGFAQFEYFHPTFLYESVWDFGVFLVLVLWLRPLWRERPGTLFFCTSGCTRSGGCSSNRFASTASGSAACRVPQLASAVGIVIASSRSPCSRGSTAIVASAA